MSTLMVWHLNDHNEPFPAFINVCAQEFQERFGYSPVFVQVNPKQKFAHEFALPLRVEYNPQVLIDNLYLGPIIKREPRHIPEDFHYEPLI